MGSGSSRRDVAELLANNVVSRSTRPSGEYPHRAQTRCHCVDCAEPLYLPVLQRVRFGGLRRVKSAVT